MPHQDQGCLPGAPKIVASLNWLVSCRPFGHLSFRKGCSWTPQSLVQAALVWGWGEEAALTDRYFTARQIIAQRDDRQHELVSYQAFMKLLRRHSALLLLAFIEALQRRMQSALCRCYCVCGYVVFGVDGTRIDAPRTVANEQAFGAAQCRTRCRGRRRRAARKKAVAPRVWLTTLWHIGSGLPWSWTHGPSDSSERDHLRSMLACLPQHSLLTADAGFVGYEFWQTLLGAGHDLLIRVGANVTLLKALGYFRECADRVYLWPDRESRKMRPPIVLRLVVVHDGKRPVYLVTSVLAKTALSDRQLVELYRARWGIEVFYRSFKRTFGRHKLRSLSPDNALVELDWSLAALWAACLHAKHQQLEAGEDLARCSVAGVLRILRRAIRDPKQIIATLLAAALIDPYHREHKANRAYPIKKTDPPGTRPPLILKASRKQVKLAAEIKRLTA